VVHLFWKGDRAWVYLNVNGPRLADRGYRKLPHDAPMRETLAAAVLLASGYDGTQALVNPMCGSGTLAIEAALLASGRAPGLLRSNYAALHTALDLEEAWKEARRRAKQLPKVAMPPPIIASDHDPRAVEAARKNALTAGVDHMIEFATCDFAETPMPEGVGHVILNPEYGLRLGETEELGATYGRIGDFFKLRCLGWTGLVFTGSRELSKRIGLRSTRRQAFMNAQIECRLLSYEVYGGEGVEEKGEVEGWDELDPG
jgi:putative N6-adenine-specific DNA methylase